MDLALTASLPPTPAPARRAAGFSLVEAILASLILLVVALGVLPLFTRAMASNLSGSESTSLSNMATGRAEELYQLPFDHVQLTVPVGSTERVAEELWTDQAPYWTLDDGEGGAPLPPGRVLWTRQTRIRQFNVNDLLGASPTPLDGGTPPGSVHVKEIEVEVASARANSFALGASRALRVRLFKAQ